ncbi:MAG: nucleotide exchange factor GrpE [Candidatus Saccharimonas sp.]
MTKKTINEDLEQQVGELTIDLQRVRADFENYRKRVESEKLMARRDGEKRAILQLLPVIDTIERAVTHIPADIADHQWVKGVAGLVRQLEKLLTELNLQKIDATKGMEFNPEFHQAVQFDEQAQGDSEVVAEELQSGYMLGSTPIRHAMVKVTKQ